MAHVIAVAGKGGVEKRLFASVDSVSLRQEKDPVLAVDADANSNLNEVLGVDVEMTLGEIREDVERSADGSTSKILPECPRLTIWK